MDFEFVVVVGFFWFILYGLCIYGMICKVIVDVLLDFDVMVVVGYGVCFVGVVYLGEMFMVNVWKDGCCLVVSVVVFICDNVVVFSGVELVLV